MVRQFSFWNDPVEARFAYSCTEWLLPPSKCSTLEAVHVVRQ